MPQFKYVGVVVNGEVDEGNGNIVPNVIRTIEAYGYEFSNDKYTEVPEDAVAYQGRVFDPLTRTRKPQPVYVVDKLRGNIHYQEKGAK